MVTCVFVGKKIKKEKRKKEKKIHKEYESQE